MATKKTVKSKPTTSKSASPVEELTTRFRVKFGQIDDELFNDYYDFWVDKDGEIRVEDLYFNTSKQAAQVLRDMAQFLESYNEKIQGK